MCGTSAPGASDCGPSADYDMDLQLSQNSLPAECDMLFAYATLEGNVAWWGLVHIACHVIHTRVDPSFPELHGIF